MTLSPQRQQQFKIIKKMLGIMNVKPHQLILLIIISLVVASLETLGIGLLVPLAQGITDNQFSTNNLPGPLIYFANLITNISPLPMSSALIFFILAGLIFTTNLLSVSVSFFYNFYGRFLQGKYLWNLHTHVYNRYFSFGKQFFDQTSQGTIKKILEYTTRVVELVRISQNSLSNITQLLGYLIIMTWLSWQLMIFILLIFPILYLSSKKIMRRVNKLWQQSKNVTMDLGHESYNILSSLPLIWSYSLEKQAQKKYARMNETFRRVQLKAQTLGYFTILIPRLVTILTLFIVVAFIAIGMHRQSFTDLSRIIIFLYVASRTVPLFKVFNSIWNTISEMSPPLLEIARLTDDKNKHIVKNGATKFNGLKQSIRFNNLSFNYADHKKILNNINFTVEKGKFTALVGPSGSGKSTIINVLMRYYECPPKTVYIDNQDIRTLDIKSLRKHIAVVDQDPILLHDSLRHNLTYGHKHVSEQTLKQTIDKVQLHSLIKHLPNGINTVVGDRGVQLSGGEKQRVAIARALLKESDILLLDEATSALDSSTEKYIKQALEELSKHKTTLVIAHRLSTIQNADQIIYIKNGHVTEQGTLSKLLNQDGEFAKQWRTQISFSN